MADNHTESSFLIPCSKEQAALGIEAINIVSNATEEEKHILLNKPEADRTLLEKLVMALVEYCMEQTCSYPGNENNSWIDEELYLQLGTEIDCDGLNIFSEVDIDLNHAVIFTETFLKLMDLPHLVEISAAHTCSSARIDEFVGTLIMVSKDQIRYLDWEAFARLEREAHEAQVQYSLCEVMHYSGESSSKQQFLMTSKATESASGKVMDILMTFSEDGVDNDGLIVTSTEENDSCCLHAVHALTPSEYAVLAKYIPKAEDVYAAALAQIKGDVEA